MTLKFFKRFNRRKRVFKMVLNKDEAWLKTNVEPATTASVYHSSKQSINLLGETGRSLFPEDLAWAKKQVPSLRELCLLSAANSLKNLKRPRSAHTAMVSSLLPEDLVRFLQLAPTDTPLAVATALLPDGIYWQRRALATWGAQNWPRFHGGSWRRLVLERQAQHWLENLNPKTCTATVESIRPIGPLVVCLRLHKLMETCGDGEAELDLLQLELDLRGIFELFVNLQELHLMFEHTDFLKPLTWKPNPVKISCCRAIGAAIPSMKNFRVLRVRRSHLQKPKLSALLSGLVNSDNLTRIDMTSCCLQDSGGQLLADVLITLPSLQELFLADNAIGPTGGIAIGTALRKIFENPDHSLQILDFNLNMLCDAGAYAVLSSLCQRKYPPIEMEDDLESALASACTSRLNHPPIPEIIQELKLTDELTFYGFPKPESQNKTNGKGGLTQLFFAAVEMTHALTGLIRDVIDSTDSLIILDIRNNHLGPDACASFLDCDRLIRLDLRMSGGTAGTEAALWASTLRRTNQIQPHFNLRAIRNKIEEKLREQRLMRKPCVRPPQPRISIAGAIAVSVAVPHWKKHSLRGYVQDAEALGPDVTKVPF